MTSFSKAPAEDYRFRLSFWADELFLKVNDPLTAASFVPEMENT